MTKEITKAKILQELQDKFALREFLPEPFLFGEAVMPVYDIGQHVQKWETEYSQVNITSMAGFLFLTVPATEKWHIQGYNIIFMGAGAIKVTGLYISRAASPSNFRYLDMTKNQTISYAITLPQLVTLGPGDRIYILCDDYTSSQNLRLFVDVMKEEIR